MIRPYKNGKALLKLDKYWLDIFGVPSAILKRRYKSLQMLECWAKNKIQEELSKSGCTWEMDSQHFGLRPFFILSCLPSSSTILLFVLKRALGRKYRTISKNNHVDKTVRKIWDNFSLGEIHLGEIWLLSVGWMWRKCFNFCARSRRHW